MTLCLYSSKGPAARPASGIAVSMIMEIFVTLLASNWKAGVSTSYLAFCLGSLANKPWSMAPCTNCGNSK
eukprot:CAMPEP_0180437162 /NCGR_PEP_ID=MMETSP1036_2-20121128/11397_1 /TAXON_ID=632150 /ORGANISM="Azadinium spinosum, Strain 3D9" /LENGTH=69 /DNA_ID=CAMNT_0022443195 /DNA_START=265 /DNA_END=474 /DNA_ORIENTATION=+